MSRDGIMKSAILVGSCTATSRIMGLVRNMVMASAFGTSMVQSAFVIAFRIPNLFRGLFGEGALSAAFVPVFTEAMEKEGRESAQALASRALSLLAAVLGVIVLAVILGATLALEFATLDTRGTLILSMLRIMLPYALFICLAALCMGILNSHRHFFVPAITPVLLNVVWILGVVYVCPMLGATQEQQIYGAAWSVLLAGAIQLAVQIPAFFRIRFRLSLRVDWNDAKVRRMLLLMGPAALGMGVFQVNVLIASFLALAVAPWAPAALSFAEFLVYLPLAMIATAMGTVLLPTLSRQAARDAHSEIRHTLGHALGNLMLLMIPAAVGLTVLASPVVQLLYEWPGREFDSTSTLQTARALVFFAPGLPLFGSYKILVPTFYALKDTKTPVQVSLCIVLLNFLLNILFILTWPTDYKHAGLMFATVLSSGTNAVILGALLSRRIGSPGWGRLMRRGIRILIASSVMGVAVYYVHGFLAGGGLQTAWFDAMPVRWAVKATQAVEVLGSIVSGLGVYGLVAFLLCRDTLAAEPVEPGQPVA